MRLLDVVALVRMFLWLHNVALACARLSCCCNMLLFSALLNGVEELTRTMLFR